MSNEFLMVQRELVERTAAVLREAYENSTAEELETILSQPAEQHQGEPVSLPERLSAPGNGVSHPLVPRHLVWNACLDEITKLGPLYTHAHVERLRAELAQCEAMAAMIAEREWAEHAGTGSVSSKVEAAFTQLHNDLHEAGATLAERDALLRELDDAWNSHDGKDRFGKLMQKVEALYASAEPSAPVEIDNHASGCCCPPKGYSGIWAAAMCPVHQGIRRLERKPS